MVQECAARKCYPNLFEFQSLNYAKLQNHLIHFKEEPLLNIYAKFDKIQLPIQTDMSLKIITIRTHFSSSNVLMQNARAIYITFFNYFSITPSTDHYCQLSSLLAQRFRRCYLKTLRMHDTLRRSMVLPGQNARSGSAGVIFILLYFGLISAKNDISEGHINNWLHVLEVTVVVHIMGYLYLQTCTQIIDGNTEINSVN